MEIGVIRIGPSLLVLIAIGICGWLLSHYLLVRRARKFLAESRGSDVVTANARLRMSMGLRSLAAAVVIGPTLVALVYAIAQWRIEKSAEDPSRIQAVIATRDFIEDTLGMLTGISAGTWVLAILVIAAIWISARYSSSRRSWARALDARRQAYAEALSSQEPEALLEQARVADAARFAKLSTDAARITEANRSKIAEMETAQVVTLPGRDGAKIPMSVAEIRVAIFQLEGEAGELEATEPAGTAS